MNKRKAKKIFNALYYFDTWIHPERMETIVVPHSGKHWYLWCKACDKLHLQEYRDNYIEDMLNRICL